MAAVTEGEIRDKPGGDLAAGRIQLPIEAFAPGGLEQAVRLPDKQMGFCAEDHDVFFKYRFFPTNVQRWFVKNSISYAALAVDKASSLTSLSIKKLFKFSRIICYT